MHCELAVPGLLALKLPGRFPAAEMLLSRGRRQRKDAIGFESFLMGLFELGGTSVPAGALTAIASGTAAGDSAWIRADPVHLQVMRDHLAVVPPEGLEIERAEADALCEALNQHFAGNIEFRMADARRWCARASKDLPAGNEPALERAGREVPVSRESGPLLTEIQMLLHTHPVNAAREARGAPVVNSLWLWGAGRAPAVEANWKSVTANEPLAIGLARLARARSAPLPASAAGWLERVPEEGRHLVVLDALRAPAALEDLSWYEKNLDALESAWFAPLLAALREGRIGMITVHVPERGGAFETVRGDLRRFWRRPRPLEHLA